MFTFIKETWKMAKMLFQSKPSDFDKLIVMEMECYPFSGYSYLTWCGYCIVRKNTKDIDNIPAEDMNHENIHLEQAKNCGTWLKFYSRYLWSWFRLSPLFGKFGYYLNKYETEAYAKEEVLEYLERRPSGYVSMYDQENKRQVWKESRESPYFYKKLIKEKFKNL